MIKLSRRNFLIGAGAVGLTAAIVIGSIGNRSRLSFRSLPKPIKYFASAGLSSEISLADIRRLSVDIVEMQKMKLISPDIHVHFVKLFSMMEDLFSQDSEELDFINESLSFLLDQTKFRPFGRADKLFLRSPWGVAYRTVPRSRPLDYFAVPNGISHRDGALESFVEIGLPLNTAFKFEDGHHATLVNLLEDSLARFSVSEGDLEWTATAYSYLFYSKSTWRNKNDEQYSFADLARHLYSAINKIGPCFGTHRIIALAHLLFSGSLEHHPISYKLEDGVREWCKILDANQSEDGSWNQDYLKSEAFGKYPNVGESRVDVAFNVTCHILEYLSLIPDSYFENGAKLRMAQMATRYFFDHVRDPLYGGLERNIAPTCHGIRAIYHLLVGNREN
jgi:hypothetical protein